MIGANNQDFRTIPSLWPELDGLRVLDLGCGQGLYALELARRGALVIGVDRRLDDLRVARGQQGPGNRYFVCADAADLPLRAGVLDMAVSVEVLTHIPPRTRAGVLQSVARLLKEEGRFYYTLHNSLRLSLGRWARGRGALEKYPTANLDVWPLNPPQGRGELAACGMSFVGPVRYMNYHSRFNYAYYRSHPRASRWIIALENAISRLPLLRRLAITFLLVGVKGQAPERAEAGAT